MPYKDEIEVYGDERSCSYVQRKRKRAMIAGHQGAIAGGAVPVVIEDAEAIRCSHPSRLRKLGGALVDLCKCHHTRLKKQSRYAQKRFSRRKPL